MFYVRVRSWLHSDTHIYAPSFWTLRILGNYIQGPSGNLLKEQVKVKVKQSHYRPGQALRVPGG